MILDVIGSTFMIIGLVVGKILSTKHLTFFTGSITFSCRTVRFYCEKYRTFWGCSIAAGQGVKEAIKFTVKSVN
jgi:hypothetical protein